MCIRDSLILVDTEDSTTESTGGVRDLVFTSGTTGNWDDGFSVYIHNSGTDSGEAIFTHNLTVFHGDYDASLNGTIENFRARGIPDRFTSNIEQHIYTIKDLGGLAPAVWGDSGGEAIRGKYYIEAMELDLFADTRTLTLVRVRNRQWETPLPWESEDLQ